MACIMARASSSASLRRGAIPTSGRKGVIVRVMQRILALTAAIRHNGTTGQQVLRSLTAYDPIDLLALAMVV